MLTFKDFWIFKNFRCDMTELWFRSEHDWIWIYPLSEVQRFVTFKNGTICGFWKMRKFPILVRYLAIHLLDTNFFRFSKTRLVSIWSQKYQFRWIRNLRRISNTDHHWQRIWNCQFQWNLEIPGFWAWTVVILKFFFFNLPYLSVKGCAFQLEVCS